MHRGSSLSYLRILDSDPFVSVNIWELDAVRSSAHVLHKQVGSGAGIQNVFWEVDSDNRLEVMGQRLLEKLGLVVIGVFVLLNLGLPFHVEVD